MPEVADLGVLAHLATAIGLVDEDGRFAPDWLADPGRHLGGVLADDGQRGALLAFCEEALGERGRQVDAAGRTWLRVVAEAEGGPEVCAVVDERGADHVEIGAGLRLAGADPVATAELYAPLFRVARSGSAPVAGAIFAGEPGAHASASVSVSFDREPGAGGLDGLELGFELPTAAEDDGAAVSLGLLGLELPGASRRDLRLGSGDGEALDDDLLELALGLIRAQAGSSGAAAEALARLLGLAESGPIPPLPVAELGADAARLSDWLHATLTGTESRAAWLAALADLLGDTAEALDGEVRLRVGGVEARIAVDAGTDPGGRPSVAPRLTLLAGDAGERQAVLELELVRSPTASGALAALPSLAAYVMLGGAAEPLLAGEPGADALRIGVAIDAGRRPRLLLALEGARVAGAEAGSLDLDAPGALAAAGAAALGEVAAGLFDRFGAAGEDVSRLLGLLPPPGSPEGPTVAAADFLQSPIVALRAHWLALTREHRDSIAPLLELAGRLLAGASASPPEGVGEPGDPWRLPLGDALGLEVRRDPAGGLALALSLAADEDGVGGGGATVATRLSLELARLDLAAGSVDFLAAAELAIGLRPRTGREARVPIGKAALIAESIGLHADWTASGGLALRLATPGSRLRSGGDEGPADLASWPALERLAGMLSAAASGGLPPGLAAAFGWDGGRGPALGLAELAADPRTEFERWLKQAIAQRDATALGDAFAALAQLLYGGAAAGSGTPADPFRPELGSEATAPLPLAWVEPGAAGGRARQLRLGLRLPLGAAGGGIVALGQVDLDLVGVDAAGETLRILADRRLRATLGLSRADGPLVEGPDPALGRIDVDVSAALGDGPGELAISLEEAGALGLPRERRRLGPGDPLLPEVRAILSAALAELAGLPALSDLLAALGLLVDGGLRADAVEALVADPAGCFVAAATASDGGLQRAIDALLVAVPGTTADLAAPRLAIELAGEGDVPWSATLAVGAAGAATAVARLGSRGLSAAGGFELELQADPPRAVGLRHRPGAAAPETIPLWPRADADAVGRLLSALVPAALARHCIEWLRAGDTEARSTLDALLAAIGLLEGERVPLPLGLLDDPAGWLAHPSALGGSLDPAKVAKLLDALRPLFGGAGGPGRLEPAAGVAIEATATGGSPRLELALDGAALGDGVLDTTVAAALVLGDGSPGIELDGRAGIAGAGAVRLRVDRAAGVELALERRRGGALPLYPASPPPGSLAAGAVEAALPAALDAIAELDGDRVGGRAAGAVVALGDALDLRVEGSFDGGRMRALAADPAAGLSSRLAALDAAGLARLAAALGRALPDGATAAADDGALAIGVGQAALKLRADPFELSLSGRVEEIPAAGSLSLSLRLGDGELAELRAAAGPGAIDLGGSTLRPVAAVSTGAEVDERGFELGFGVGEARSLRARWDLESGGVTLAAVDGDRIDEEPAAAALATLAALGDLLAGVALSGAGLRRLLERGIGSAPGHSVRDLLVGVLLDVDDPERALAGAFALDSVRERLLRLAANAAAVGPRLEIEGFAVALSGGADGEVSLAVSPGGRAELVRGEIGVALEADSRWIAGQPPPGLALRLLERRGEIAPALACNGLGIRISRASGPLLDRGISLGSIALHLFGRLGDEAAGGIQLQLGDLAVPLGGADGGDSVGRGLLAGGGGDAAPAFSPALAVQGGPGRAAAVSLSAGAGGGPWWQPVQTSFGPLYFERIGLGVEAAGDRLERVAVLVDGRVSIFGLAAAVDGLELAHRPGAGGSVFEPAGWEVGLAGLAIDAEIAGVSIAGGLRRVGEGEYVGMLAGRWGVYALSLYGGYGEGRAADGRSYASFFAFGAVNAPIGGAPAFFVTGIAGGIGINRGLELPSEPDQVTASTFVAALDPSRPRDEDPMVALRRMQGEFPMVEGDFWFAAGISFNSFALVDGIAVISVAAGDGLEVALIGLARLALPRPEIALGSIEVGLRARFSTAEGVLWIQGQLTDNSWLLSESARLSGGFAFVIWFSGPHAGEFVLTLGGYHPSFHRDHFPACRPLGLCWQVSPMIAVKGRCYFALTSEAVMAGAHLEACASLGPAWAEVSCCAHTIVYFDPARIRVDVHASISAGVSVRIWPFGRVSISVHIGASVALAGPKFQGVARFDVGPVELEVGFGDDDKDGGAYLAWDEFVVKYLEQGGDGVARLLSATPGRGAVPAAPAADRDRPAADGMAERPFEVLPEFELVVRSSAPVAAIGFVPGAEPASVAVDHALGIAPIGAAALESTLRLTLERVEGGARTLQSPHLFSPLEGGGFPIGIWGPPGDGDSKAIPTGELLRAGEGARLEAGSEPFGGLAAEVAYLRVEPAEKRHPLPLAADATVGAAPRARPVSSPAVRAAARARPQPEIAPPRVLAVLSDPDRRAYTGAAAAVAGLGLDGEARLRLGRLGDGLGSGSAALAGGEIAVLSLPDARRDVSPLAPRPRLRVSGAARIAVLRLGGEILSDSIADVAEAPPAAERIAVLEDGGADGGAGLLGWHSGGRLAYVGWGAALVPGGIVQVPAGGVRPNRQRGAAGWVEAVELVRSGASVTTRFVAPVRSVAIAVDDGDPADPDPALAGASLVRGERTRVSAGAREYAVYGLAPDGGGPVTVAAGGARPPGGVLASTDLGVAELAERLGEKSPDALLQPLTTAPAADGITLEWVAPGRPQGGG